MEKNGVSGIGKINNAFKLLSPSALAAAAGVTAIVAAVKQLVGFGSQIINVTSQFEQVEASLKTVLGSAEKGQQMFEELRRFSFQTTFGVDELAGASAQLLNVGVSTHALQKDLKMLGDLAQGDKAKFQELTSIFAKVQSTGKANSQQLQQLALRGIPILQTLKDMGVQGTASAEQLSQAFEKLTAEGGKFHNAMENINDTIEGKKGFISDTWKEILVNLGEITGLTDFWKNTLDTVKNKLNDVNEWLIRIKKLNDGGVLSREDNITDLQKDLAKLQKQRDEFVKLNAGDTSESYYKKLEWLDNLITERQAQLDILLESEQRWQRSVEQTKKAMAEYEEQYSRFDNVKSNIKNLYYASSAGEKEGKIAQLQEYKEMLNTQRRVKKYLQNGVEYEVIEKLDSESIRMLKSVIADLEKEINGTDKAVQNLGKSWKEVFKEVTGMTVKAEENGAAVSKRFIEGLSTDTLEEQLAKTIGLDTDGLAKMQNNAETLKKTILSLMSAETKAGDEFKWDDKSIQNMIAEYQTLIGKIKEEQEARKEAERKQGVEKELESLRAEGQLLEKQIALLEQEGSTFQQINDLRREAEYLTKGMTEQEAKLAVQIENENKARQNKFDYKSELKVLDDMLALDTSIYDETVLRRFIEKEITEEEYKQLEAKNKLFAREMEYRRLEEQSKTGNISDSLSAYRQIATMHLQDERPGGFSDFVTAVKDFVTGVGDFDGVITQLKEQLQSEYLGEYASATVKQDAYNMMQGSEIDTFLKTFEQTENIYAGVIAMVSQAFFSLLGGMEGVRMILNPITEILKAFMPIFKTLLVPLLLILKLLSSLANAIMKLLDVITFGLFSAGEKLYDSLVGLEESSSSLSVQQSIEVERLRQLNAQYAALKLAIKDQEEYYLKKRRELNADFINQQISAGLSVHDMILTPQGNFSTDPNDYIIATKNPQGLAGGTQVNVIVNNSIADRANVDVQQQTGPDGMQQLVIAISSAVAKDYANGTNGWDGAIYARAAQGVGRSLS